MDKVPGTWHKSSKCEEKRRTATHARGGAILKRVKMEYESNEILGCIVNRTKALVLVKNNEDEKGLSRDELYLLAWAIWYAYVLVKNNEDEKGLSRDELYLLACLRSFMHMHMFVPPQDVEISRTAIQDMITPKVASILQVVFYDTSRLRVLVLCPVLEP